MAMPDKGFGWRKLAILEEMELIMSDLTSKIGPSAHPACNGNACTETGPPACLRVPVVFTKLHILRYSDKMNDRLDCVCGIVPFSILETGFYNMHQVVPLIRVVLYFLWSEKHARRLDSMPL